MERIARVKVRGRYEGIDPRHPAARIRDRCQLGLFASNGEIEKTDGDGPKDYLV